MSGTAGHPPQRRHYAATGVTDASGNVTFSFPAGAFSSPPAVELSFQGSPSNSPVDYRITALSAASVTAHVRQSTATVIALLGLTLLAQSIPLAGATIHLVATRQG